MSIKEYSEYMKKIIDKSPYTIKDFNLNKIEKFRHVKYNRNEFPEYYDEYKLISKII